MRRPVKNTKRVTRRRGVCWVIREMIRRIRVINSQLSPTKVNLQGQMWLHLLVQQG
jgi:hypothetical protein